MDATVTSRRTTVTLEPEVLAGVVSLRRGQQLSLSEAVNLLARRGMARPTPAAPFRQRTADLGLHLDVSNVAEVLDVLDGVDHR